MVIDNCYDRVIYFEPTNGHCAHSLFYFYFLGCIKRLVSASDYITTKAANIVGSRLGSGFKNSSLTGQAINGSGHVLI